MSGHEAAWRLVVVDVTAMSRFRAARVLAATGLTYVEAFGIVDQGPRRFTSGPLTQRQAERVAATARRYGAAASVERLTGGSES